MTSRGGKSERLGVEEGGVRGRGMVREGESESGGNGCGRGGEVI